MDSVIPAISVLFVLSMICERIAEFFKTYLCGKKWGKFELIGDTSTKYPVDSPAEQRRHYRILKLNLWCGFITALLCRASLFDILKDLKNPSIGWPSNFSFQWNCSAIPSNIAFAIGCFLTGAFISLGSKFWHDLLDIMVEVKNAKRNTSETGTTTDYNLLSEQEKFDLLTSAIRENKAIWRSSVLNYTGVSISNKLVGTQKLSTNQLAIQFNVTQKIILPDGSINRVPGNIFYNGFKIPTDVLATGNVIAISSQIDPKQTPRPLGSSIGRGNTDFSGTLGIAAYLTVDKVKHFCGVSCYHVLFPDELLRKVVIIESEKDKDLITAREVYAPSTKDSTAVFNLGSVIAGKVNEFVDIGFFTTSDSKIANEIFGRGEISGIRRLTLNDNGVLEVSICGRTSSNIDGIVMSAFNSQIVNYFKDSGNPFSQEIENLIQISMKCKEGDSGSAVITKDGNELVGIVVGSSGDFTYAIPVKSIESHFNIEFITKPEK